jgi:pSer/pThr/pTyr-binding forkhead associated (FHA) protein
LVGWLVVVESRDLDRDRAFPIRDRLSFIGRSQQAPGRVIGIAERGISGLHAALYHQDGTYRLVDLDSQNGTFLGTQRLHPLVSVELEDYDVIRVSKTKLVFRAFQHVAR